MKELMDPVILLDDHISLESIFFFICFFHLFLLYLYLLKRLNIHNNDLELLFQLLLNINLQILV
jgi:hypothetical protein